MKKTLLLTALLATTSQAQPLIIGDSTSIQVGNTTFTTGTTPGGESWSATSQSVGNTTFHNGSTSSGETWSGTSQQIGDFTFQSGTVMPPVGSQAPNSLEIDGLGTDLTLPHP